MSELTELPDAARQRALERYRKLQPHLEQDVPLAHVARAAGLPERTARRWVALYRRLGLAGFRAQVQPDKRCEVGTGRWKNSIDRRTPADTASAISTMIPASFGWITCSSAGLPWHRW